MLQLLTLLLLHPFIHLMLELLLLPHNILLQCYLFTHPLMILFTLNILLPQLLPLSTPLLLHSAGHSLHRSVIDMSSIHHAPTAEDYCTFTPQLLLLLLTVMLKPLYDPYCSCFQSFFRASASISTLPILVVFYHLSRHSDDH